MNAAFLAAAGSPASILPPRTIPCARFNPFAPPAPALAPPIAPPSSPPPVEPPPTQHSAPSTQYFSSPRDSRLASRDYSALVALAHAIYHRNLERIAEADLRGQPPDAETLRRLDLLRRQFVSAANLDLRERTLNARLARDAQAAARRADVHARSTTAARTAADRPRCDPLDDDDHDSDDATTSTTGTTETTLPSRARSRSRSRSRAPDLPLLPVNPADITPPPLEDDDFAPPALSPRPPDAPDSAPTRADPDPASCPPPQHSAPSTQHFPAAPP